MSATILIVEDDAVFRDFLRRIMDNAGYSVALASDGREGYRRLQKEHFDLVLCDLKMPFMSGLELFRSVNAELHPPLFIFITAFGRVEEAVEAIREGAVDFLTKPLKDPETLLAIVKKGLQQVEIRRLAVSLKESEQAGIPPEELVFAGKAMEKVKKLVFDVAPTMANVMVCGESGTGKELVARMIHLLSPRKNAPFVPVNCAAIPENLLESELFGHERGAFTGAVSSRRGKFELAQGGTIFLDEIGDMPLALQAKLLRVLQERLFERVGGTLQIKADIRVIAATNRDLEQEVKEKRFREDLYYRLNVFPIILPPLNERVDAIASMVAYFSAFFSARSGLRKRISVSGEAMSLLEQYSWPGNVRELQNVIERGVILARDEITPAELPEQLQKKTSERGGGELLKSQENEAICRTLRRFSGNRRMTAEALGISLRTLQYRLKRLGLSGKNSGNSPSSRETD